MTRLSGNTFTEQPEIGELLDAYDTVQAVLAEDRNNPRALRYKMRIEALIRDREEEYWQGLVAQAVESAYNGDFFAADHALARATLYPLSSLQPDQPHALRAHWIATGRALIGAMRELAAGNPVAARQTLVAAPRTTSQEREWANKADKLIDLAALDTAALSSIAQQLQSDVAAPTPQNDPLPQLARAALPSGRTRPADFSENLYAARLRSEVPMAKQQQEFARLRAVMEQARSSGELIVTNDAIHQMRALMPPQYRPQLNTWASGLDQIYNLRQEMHHWADNGRPDKALAVLNRLHDPASGLTPKDPTLSGLRDELIEAIKRKPLPITTRYPALLWAGVALAAVLLLGVGVLAGRAVFTPGGGSPSPTSVGATATPLIVAPLITPTVTPTVAVASPTSFASATVAATAAPVPDTATPVTPIAAPVSPTQPTATTVASPSSTATGTPSTTTPTAAISPTPLFFVQVTDAANIRSSVVATSDANILTTLHNPTVLAVFAVKQDTVNTDWYQVTIPAASAKNAGKTGWVNSKFVTKLTPSPTPTPSHP